MFGGSFDGKESADQVIAKLKSRASSATEAQVVGLRGYFLDPRIEPVMQTAGEAAGDRERAYWNPAIAKFELAGSGPLGIKEFRLNEDLDESDFQTEARDTVMDYSHESNWVWDYQDRVADLPLGPTVVATVSVPETGVPPSTSVPPPPPPPPGILNPPNFAIPPGSYPIASFDLNVPILNPNPAGSSTLIYCLDYGNWVPLAGPLVTVGPGQVLKAQALPVDPALWESSSVTEGTYTVSLATLLPPAITMSGGAFNLPAVDTINVGFTNPNNQQVSRVDYRLDGGPWQTAGGNFSVKAVDYPAGVLIEAYTVSTDPYWLDSGVVSAPIGVIVTPPPNLSLTTGIDPGSWAVSGATATYTFDDGTSIRLTEVGTSWSTGTVNTWNAWSKPIDGTGSVEANSPKELMKRLSFPCAMRS